MRNVAIQLMLALPALSQCWPSPTTVALLGRLDVPRDASVAASAHRREQSKVLREALRKSPGDIFLHVALQDLNVTEQRSELIAEYERLLAAKPSDPRRQYLAARMVVSRRTPEAITLLEKALKTDPKFPWPHLLRRSKM